MLKKHNFSSTDFPKLFAIINSRIRSAATLDYLTHFCTQNKMQFAFTETPNHINILSKNSKAYEGILVAGGDGTLHEAINGCDLHSQYIVYIPAGSINCLGRHWKIKNIPDMISSLHNARIEQVDLIETQLQYSDGKSEKCFIWGFAGLGYEGTLTELAERLRKLPPPLRYMLAAWGSTFISHPFNVSCFSGTLLPKPLRYTSVFVNNAAAHIVTSLSEWDMTDGTFEARAVCRSAFTQLIANASRYVKLPISPEWIKNLKSLRIVSDRPLTMMADGNVYKNVVEVSFDLFPRILNIAVPNGKQLKKEN